MRSVIVRAIVDCPNWMVTDRISLMPQLMVFKFLYDECITIDID